MHDLKRCDVKRSAYKQLQEAKVRVFVPSRWRIILQGDKKVHEEVPIIQDLLFVYDSCQHLDSVVEGIETLQYRWLRNVFRELITMPDLEVNRFMQTVDSSDSPKYYLPERITPQMCGCEIRIMEGPFNGCGDCLPRIRGNKIEHLLAELKGYLAIDVEVLPEYIQFV